MKHFRLNILLLSIGGIGFGVLSGILMAHNRIAWAIVALLAALICLSLVIALSRRVLHLTSSFVAALENNDRTMRFDTASDEREIREMSQSMNRIMAIYQRNQLELETCKLYYDRVLRIMTHEMRNSITPVIALANDYSNHPEKYDTAMLSETMGVIGTQADGIKKFLDSYYNLTHLPEPQIKSVEADAFCNRVLTLIRLEEQQRGFAIPVCRFSVPVNMKIDVDADLMTQAVMNILRNALDAVAEVENPKIDISVSISDGIPFISITDNGPGIPDAMKPNLFQPFFSTKPGGSGIGLSLSRQIARLHGGDLTLTSIPQHGTVVVISFSR